MCSIAGDANTSNSLNKKIKHGTKYFGKLFNLYCYFNQLKMTLEEFKKKTYPQHLKSLPLPHTVYI